MNNSSGVEPGRAELGFESSLTPSSRSAERSEFLTESACNADGASFIIVIYSFIYFFERVTIQQSLHG